MAKDSNIEWCRHTFNPWRGCTKVSDGCKACYAETLSKRNPKVLGMWGPKGQRVAAAESYWQQPIQWNREAGEAGERHRVFCASLADVFEGPETCPEDSYDVVLRSRIRLWKLIEGTPNLDWLLLTKRPEKILAMLPHRWLIGGKSFPGNVWVGTSVENQEAADKRIPHLLKVPAVVLFLSVEPLLSPLVLPFTTERKAWEEAAGYGLSDWFFLLNKIDPDRRIGNGIHWVIVGGESGPHARPIEADWVRSLRNQCAGAGVPFLFKQWGGKDKKAAGRLLDGELWNEFPKGCER